MPARNERPATARRAGKSGAWRRSFSAAQDARFNAHHTERCAALGLNARGFDFGAEPEVEAAQPEVEAAEPL